MGDTTELNNSNFRIVFQEICTALRSEGRWHGSAWSKGVAVTNKARELGYSQMDAVGLGDFAEQMYEQRD